MDWVAHPALAWVAAAAVLGVAELAVPGVFLVFLSIAATITGAALAVLPALPLAAQLGSFSAWTVAAVVIGRRWYRDYPLTTSDPLLNDRAVRLVGTMVTVAEAIRDGRGRVTVGDGSWFATGPDANLGERVRVIAVDEGTLVVAPLAPPTTEAGAEAVESEATRPV